MSLQLRKQSVLTIHSFLGRAEAFYLPSEILLDIIATARLRRYLAQSSWGRRNHTSYMALPLWHMPTETPHHSESDITSPKLKPSFAELSATKASPNLSVSLSILASLVKKQRIFLNLQI